MSVFKAQKTPTGALKWRAAAERLESFAASLYAVYSGLSNNVTACSWQTRNYKLWAQKKPKNKPQHQICSVRS